MRALALVLLLVACLFIAFSPPVAVALRNAIFDGYQRLRPLERPNPHVAVVLIDENSISRHGPWPWPRDLLARLIQGINAQKPLAIGLDLIFPEPDRFSARALAEQVQGLPPDVVKRLAAMPSNDERFAAAIAGTPVVLGISAERLFDGRFPEAPAAAPVRLAPGVAEGLVAFGGHIGNMPQIDGAAAGRGAMNAGPDDQVVRIVPLVQMVQGTPVPSLGLETLRVAAESGIVLERTPGGLLALRLDTVRVRLQDDGRTWLRYSRYDAERTVPAALVLSGELDPETFANKIVLVGISGLGVLDYKTTPLGEFIPGVNIHAHVVENLLGNISLVRYDWAPLLEAGILLAFGLVVIAFVPRLSALRGINLAIGMVLLMIVGAVVAFLEWHALFDAAWPTLGLAAVFGSVVVGTLSEADRQRRQLREDAAHMAGEVDAARRIQMGLLPDPREVLGSDRRFELAATLEPARTVGGDFYDCFRIDARRIFFVVADVSGKGLPAALFMAATKSHLKSAALRGGTVGEVLTRAQDEIARENPEQLFVTGFAAVLDAQTGELEFANAGHEPPFARMPHGAPERIAGEGGPPLCVLEDFGFPTVRRTLQPGEWLLVVTDGVTEGMNPAREFFGVERLLASLAWLPQGARAGDIVARVQGDLAKFCDGAEAADDVTLLALRWEGPDTQGRAEA